MKESGKNYKRVVVKIGSSILCSEAQVCERARFLGMATQICQLIGKEAKEIVVVSSGAIALGMGLVSLPHRPKELPLLQACAALGQNVLMDNYGRAFEEAGSKLGKTVNCAQVLLTWDDFINRARYLNAKNTLATLLKMGAVPVVNENDTISTEEIRFGDNDRLSALVATLVNADLLVILSDVDGLLDKNKQVVPLVTQITPEVRALVCPSRKKACVGGMVTKIDAIKIALDAGIPCVIANGRRENIIRNVIYRQGGAECGTVFLPARGLLKSRERWIAFGTKTKGRIIVDDGAARALSNHKSLLSVGILSVEGNFEQGDVVSVCNPQRVEFARGKSNFARAFLEGAKVAQLGKEVIHRDNIVIF